MHLLVLPTDCDFCFQVLLWLLMMAAFRSFIGFLCTLWGYSMAPHLPQQVSELGMNLPSNGKELEVLLSTSRPYSSLGHHWLWLE